MSPGALGDAKSTLGSFMGRGPGVGGRVTWYGAQGLSLGLLGGAGFEAGGRVC